MVFEVEVFKVFLLAAVRISGLIVSAPILSSRNFPIIAKIGLIGLTAVLVTPMIPALHHTLPDDMIGFTVYGVGELAIGLMLGVAMTLTFAAVDFIMTLD